MGGKQQLFSRLLEFIPAAFNNSKLLSRNKQKDYRSWKEIIQRQCFGRTVWHPKWHCNISLSCATTREQRKWDEKLIQNRAESLRVWLHVAFFAARRRNFF